MLAHGTGTEVTKDGAKNWYIVYPDYAFGQDMEKTFSAAIKAAGGTVVGSDPTPFPNDNFSTFLLKAPTLNPKPQVLGTMQAGGDLVNLVKQYNEFKLRDKGVGLAVGLMFLTDIHSLGPDALAGTTLHRRLVLELRRQTTAPGPTSSRPRPASGPTFAHAGQLLGRAAVPGGGAARPAPTTPTRWSSSSRATRSTTCSPRNGTIRAEDHLLLHDAYLAAGEAGQPRSRSRGTT